MQDYTFAPDTFSRTDLAAAVEALQVTFGNICEDNEHVDVLDDAGVIVTESLWNAARAGRASKVMFCLGYLSAWAEYHDVLTPSLEMRLMEVRNNVR